MQAVRTYMDACIASTAAVIATSYHQHPPDLHANTNTNPQPRLYLPR